MKDRPTDRETDRRADRQIDCQKGEEQSDGER